MVPIELDKPRNLHFPLSELRELERALGRPIGGIIGELALAGVNTTIVTLYYGLKHEDPGLNPRLIEKMLERRLEEPTFRLGPVWDAIDDALKATGLFRTEKDVEQGKDRTPAPA